MPRARQGVRNRRRPPHDAKSQPVIIVKKKRHATHGHHGGAWKVAYADFVTAMMAFFLVMWLVEQSKAVKAALGGYFRDPGVFEHEQSHRHPARARPLASPTRGRRHPRPPPDRPADESETGVDWRRARGASATMLSKLPDFDKLKGQIEIQATPDGMRIELIDSNDGTFFDSASAALKPADREDPRRDRRELDRAAPTGRHRGAHGQPRRTRVGELHELGAVGRSGQRGAPADGADRSRSTADASRPRPGGP